MSPNILTSLVSCLVLAPLCERFRSNYRLTGHNAFSGVLSGLPTILPEHTKTLDSGLVCQEFVEQRLRRITMVV